MINMIFSFFIYLIFFLTPFSFTKGGECEIFLSKKTLQKHAVINIVLWGGCLLASGAYYYYFWCDPKKTENCYTWKTAVDEMDEDIEVKVHTPTKRDGRTNIEHREIKIEKSKLWLKIFLVISISAPLMHIAGLFGFLCAI